MTTLGSFNIRLPLDQYNFENRACLIQSATPKISRGVPVNIDVGIYEKGVWLDDKTGIVSLNLEIHHVANRGGAALVEKQVLAAAISTPAVGDWTGGTAQHARFSLTGAETNFDLTGQTDQQLGLWLVVWADKGGSDTPTLGHTILTCVEDGANLSLAALGSSNPNFRVTSAMLCQIHNPDTSKYHSIWITGAAGQETLMIGPGET